MAKDKGIGMEERSVKEAKLSDIEMDNVTLVELVDFVKRIYPAIAKSVIKDVFPELVGRAVQAEELNEYMILVRTDQLDFTSVAQLSLKELLERAEPTPMVCTDLEVVKGMVEKLKSQGVEEDHIQVVSLVDIK